MLVALAREFKQVKRYQTETNNIINITTTTDRESYVINQTRCYATNSLVLLVAARSRGATHVAPVGTHHAS